MSVYTYLFEAKSIQDYILRSGRLRHIVGASELVDSLTGELLDDVLSALRLQEDKQVRFSRRAGGAVYLFSERRETRDDFRALWSLVVRQYAPGLECISASGEGDNAYAAYRQAQEALQAARNRQPAWLPAGGPLTAYAPRTGMPAVRKHGKLGLQDAATARFGLDSFWRGGGLTGRFSTDVPWDDWPRNLEPGPEEDGKRFPFLPDNRYLGLLHADGNGLGQLLMRLGKHAKSNPENLIDLFRDFSKAVSKATTAAARDATERVLIPARRGQGDASSQADPIPARPIVLGGDDLTILLRADLALPFARVFLTAFESMSRQELSALRIRYPRVQGLPDALTAGAGIAFVRSSHPFHLAHELAESLATHAKNIAKRHPDSSGRIPPTLAFHRVTTASHGDYSEILQQEMTFGPSNERIRTTLAVYGVDAEPEHLPALGDLEALTATLGGEGVARGPARQILTLIGQDRDDARRRYSRWREVMKARDSDTAQTIERILTGLCGGLREDMPVSSTGNPPATPLGDVVTLLAIGKGAGKSGSVQEEEAA